MLERWLAEALEAAGAGDVPASEEAVRVILDLARDAAHAVDRPAAPLAAFAAGVAVGRGAALEEVAGRIAASAGEFEPEG